MHTLDIGKKPVNIWLEKEDIEEGALRQIKNLSNYPFAHNSIAVMPDTHQGYGMPIGSVLATKEVIVPNAVGVDIGCGMCVMQTSLESLSQGDIKAIFGGSKQNKGGIRASIPTGFKSHSKKQNYKHMPENDNFTSVVADNLDKAQLQIGTLGGGNHFIELQQGNDGHVYVMIHSGSRNIGYTIAGHYNEKAIEMNKRWGSVVPEKHELAFLPLDSSLGQDYIKDMAYATDFALANRLLMMQRVKDAISNVYEYTTYGKIINKPHNFAAIENHFGSNVWVHRKGATRARKNEIGMIPGSQGTKSYIVIGKGEQMSFQSCSHGAGRRMSRKKAREALWVSKEKKALEDQGVVHSIRHAKDLDEAPSAYKDIEEVMKNQEDLVDKMVELSPLGVVKG